MWRRVVLWVHFRFRLSHISVVDAPEMARSRVLSATSIKSKAHTLKAGRESSGHERVSQTQGPASLAGARRHGRLSQYLPARDRRTPHTHTQARCRARPAYATPGCRVGQYKIRHKKSITIRIIPRIRSPGSPAYCPTLRRGAGRVGRTTHERRQKKEIGKRKDSRCKRSVGCLAPRRSTRRRKSSIRKCWEMAVPLRSSLVLLAVASSHAALQRASNKRVRALIAPVISAVPTRPCPLRAGARRQPCTEKAMQI